jgi:kynurenine formamidase
MLVDVSMLIEEGSVFRPGTPPVEILHRRFFHESEGTYELAMLSLSVHTATHVDLVFPGNRIDPQRMIGIGKLVDVTQVPGDEIGLSHVEHQVDLEERDFVFFRTDWNKFANTEKYYKHPELSMDVIEWLISKKVNAIGIDALGLGRGSKHGVYDRLLVTNGIFVIENLANLSAVTQRRFRTYCFPLKLENTDAIPARVLIELIDETDGKK